MGCCLAIFDEVLSGGVTLGALYSLWLPRLLQACHDPVPTDRHEVERS